jgi:hypothetical protein
MSPDKNFRNLGPFGYYIKNALKFYELKTEYLAPVIFLILLAAGMSGTLIQGLENAGIWVNLVFEAAVLIISYFASSVYLAACLGEFSNKKLDFMEALKVVLRQAPALLVAYVVFLVAVTAGLFLLIIPGIIIYLTFMFYNCYMLNNGKGILESMNASRRLTSGTKTELFAVMLLFNIVIMLFFTFIILYFIYSGNDIIFSFVLSFLLAMSNLMNQRLIALLFTDLYKKYDIES